MTWAVNKGRLNLVNGLLEHGAAVNSSALLEAAKGGDFEIVNCLLNKLDQNSAIINTPDNRGRTPLSFAAKNSNIEIVKKLIDKGAEINSAALVEAVTIGNLEIVKLLLEQNSDLIGAKGTEVKTLLKLAKKSGNAELFGFLKKFKKEKFSKK